MNNELKDKLAGISMGFILDNEIEKSTAISDLVHLVKAQEQIIKDLGEEVEELERKLIRNKVRRYNE